MATYQLISLSIRLGIMLPVDKIGNSDVVNLPYME